MARTPACRRASAARGSACAGVSAEVRAAQLTGVLPGSVREARSRWHSEKAVTVRSAWSGAREVAARSLRSRSVTSSFAAWPGSRPKKTTATSAAPKALPSCPAVAVTPEAEPASRAGTSVRTVSVSGATIIPIPSPKTAMGQAICQ
ncbi:hypothetical protein GCM10010324_20700 [Streptomyces hiroshimensis]|uniref:Uncharacterized protein n=1 Tax=Streptomyces hiroshimensis TaxID=66424 RepID=A0ABQ2YAK6_9ACTN|nr:hypothetical protein GCM10010324_20700 [Streptomyces hiroshimensis]